MPAPPSHVTSIHVLLVEGNPGDAAILLDLLRGARTPRLTTTVRRVDCLADALVALATDGPEPRPDVVLLDLQLPDSKGVETVRRVRAAAPETAIVVLTAIGEHEVAVEAVQAGAQDYLVKDRIDADLLLRAIRYAIERERLRREALRNELFFRTAVDSAPIGKALTGLDGRWRLVNRALCELTGYPEEELVGRSFADITHPDDLDVDLAHVRRLLAGEARSYEMEKRFVRRDGTVVWALLSVSLVCDEAGAPLYFVAQIQDLTERKRAAERTQQLLAITVALTDVRTAQEISDRITTRVAGALGAVAAVLAAVQPGGDTLRVIGHVGLALEHARGWSRIPMSAATPLTEVARTGRPLWLETAARIDERCPAIQGRRALPAVDALAVLPLVLGEECIGVLAIGFTDDAASNGAHRFAPEDRVLLETVAHQCTLAVERARLYEAEQEALAAARAASEAKSRFLATMSHELRTPLTSIIGFADLMKDGVAGPVTEMQRHHLARVSTSADQLLQMINDILTLSRLEAGHEQAHAEPVLLADVVREAADLVGVAAEAKGLALGVELPPNDLVVTTDPGKLRQILINLLGNAVKFTDHGRVDVRVLDRGASVAIEVADTGIGMAPEQLARAFEPFWRAADGRRAGGTGLGLDVSLRFARLMGGELQVTSALGHGSTFTLVLPRTVDASAAPSTDAMLPPLEEPPSIVRDATGD